MCFGRGWKGFDLGIGISISNPWGHACSWCCVYLVLAIVTM